MESKRKKDIGKTLGNKIVKANEVIQKSRFSLTLQQQKIILFLIAQISSEDDEFKMCEFSIKDFCRICGIDADGGWMYSRIKDDIKALRDQSVWVETESGKERLLYWIDVDCIEKRKGTVTLKLADCMKPYLLQLRECYTSYDFIYVLRFRSKYAIRLYELIESCVNMKTEAGGFSKNFTVENLKKRLGAEAYNTWQHFRDKALVPAINEINEHSDLELSFVPQKDGGRSIKSVDIVGKRKDAYKIMDVRDEIFMFLNIPDPIAELYVCPVQYSVVDETYLNEK